MFHKLIPLFKLQMRICNIFLLTPYEWPKGMKFPIVFRSSLRTRIYKATLLAQWIYVVLMILNFMATVKNKNGTIASKLLGVVFLDCFVVTMSLRTVIFCKVDDNLHMISSFLRFEQLNPEAITHKPDNMSKILMILGMLTSFGLPSLMVAILVADACKPPHLGYMLYNTENGCEVPNLFVRISLLVFDYFMWTNSIAPACYYVFHYMFLGLHCLDHYIQVTKRKVDERFKSASIKAEVLKVGWSKDIQVSNSNTSSSSSQTSAQLSTPNKPPSQQSTTFEVNKRATNDRTVMAHHAHAFYVYRQIYILNRLYDNVLQAVFYPSIITAALSCVIISLYACLKLHRQIPMPGLAFFPLLASDGLSVIFIIKVAAGVLNQSDRFLETAKNNWKFSNKSLFKKIARSLGKVRVRFGSTNFVDKLTPFIFIDFCLTNTVNLMLIL